MADGRSVFPLPGGFPAVELRSPGAERHVTSAPPALAMLVEGFPEHQAAVVRARGAVNERTAPRFAEFLDGRLCGTVAALVLDLSGLDSLDEAGLNVVKQTYRKTQRQGIELSVVAGGCLPVLHTLTGADGADRLPVRPSVAVALAAREPG